MDIFETIRNALGNVWDTVKGSDRELPGVYAIDPSHTDEADLLAKPIAKDKRYFQVRVNELYLSYDRKLFSNYEPMLFAATEFLYAGKDHAVPTVIGPQLMPKLPTGELPERMVFTNTRVAGLHPYRGGRITLTVILYRSERDNIAQSMLKLVENAAGALDFANLVDTYMKVAKVALDGIQALLGLGKLQPLLGIRREFDPDAGKPLTPGYYVLCSQTDLDEDLMWVKDSKLYYGSDQDTTDQLTGDCYVLYSVVATDSRSDADALAFFDLYQEAKKAAATPKDESWEVAKANLASVYQMMVTSPDLTPGQASELMDDYIAEAKNIRVKAKTIGSLAPISESLKKRTDAAYEILRLK